MRARSLAPLLLVAAGCGPEFTPRSVLFDLRVLAIVADPLEVGPDEPVTLTAIRLAPPGQTIADERWSFCPFSVGSTSGYACAVPACEVALPAPVVPANGPSAAVTATPGALALECLALLAGSGSLPPEIPPELPEKLEVLFRYVVRASDGSVREAVQRLPLYPAGAPADRNAAPDIVSVEVGGNPVWASDASTGEVPILRPGGPLDVLVHVDPLSAQVYVEGGRTLTESLVVSFYTTHGRFDFDRANGPDALVTLDYEEIAGPTDAAELWVVARDLRGGQAVAGPIPFTVE